MPENPSKVESSRRSYRWYTRKMNPLKAFQQNPSSFQLWADIQIRGDFILWTYQMEDPQALFSGPSESHQWKGADIQTQDELWKETCFESFLNPEGQSLYYEFNFSWKPAWQCYVFDEYRKPQPPQKTKDFILQSMDWDVSQKKMQVKVLNQSPYRKFRVGLTAILKQNKDVTHYMALAHKGTQPDFHLAESFTLVKG